MRKPESLKDLVALYPGDKLLVLKLDVTKEDEIKVAFATAKVRYGRIDVVFNNAGGIVMGEIEGTPHGVACGLFEVWGPF